MLIPHLKQKCLELQRFLPQDKNVRRIGAVLLLSFCLFELAVWIIPLPKESLFRPSSTLVFDRKDKLLRAFTSRDDMWRIRTSLDQISPSLQKFLVVYEDRWFYFHQGINPFAMVRAVKQNISQRRIVSGGSTLTMQIARMIEPKQRNYLNKLIEVFRAIQLEQRYSKKQLLEIYFNIAPYGGNIEGAAAAAWLYFGKEPSQLSYGEAALLAAIPNSPTNLRPDIDAGKARKARDKVLKVAYSQHLISKKDYQEALIEAIPDRRLKLPFVAPHFAVDMKRRHRGESRIYSTLNLPTQLMVEDLVKQYVPKLVNEDINNAAVVIIDNQRHELLAAVGSADFFDKYHSGQVNGYLAPRSPGSALKPFVYALGFEEGVVSPQHYLEDVPIDFRGGYSPENFDSKFSGLVSVQTALEKSLNVPVINLMQKLGKDRGLYRLLRKANFSTINPEDRYGLSIALGGCEVTLLELSALYSALANEGIYHYPKTEVNETSRAGIKLFSAGSSYLVTQILTGLRRPDLPACWEFTSLPRVAWKTGTSYGHRDAWSIGYNPRYTVGVWIGNFSGEGRPGLVGAEVATPLLFEIFNKLDNGDQKWFMQPQSVDTRQVCAVSGKVPGSYCKTVVTELYLVDRSPEDECDFHQSYIVDAETGYRLPPHFSTARKTIEKTYTKWPAKVAAWMEGNGYPVERIPPIIPDWQQLLPGQSPVIRSPSTDYEYQIREGIDPKYQKICLEAAVANDVHKLYWFINGKLVGTTVPGERLFCLPEPGNHRVVCQDDQGRSSEVRLVIKE